MRTLIVLSGHPWLYRCAQWEYVKLLIKTCADSGYFYAVVPNESIVQDELPNCTILRSNTDSGYFYYRDIGSFTNVNDGQYPVDCAITFTAEMALGIDLQVNQRGFSETYHNMPIVVWHHMFHAVKDEKWRAATTFYPSIYGSERDYNAYRDFLVSRYRPTKAQEILKTATSVTLCGKDLEGMVKKAQGVEKFKKPSILFGCRFNAWHKPDEALSILEKVYATGRDFDLYITTPDQGIDDEYVKRIETLGGEIHYTCGQEKFHELLMKCHIGLITGEAASPVFVPEYVCGGTYIVAEKPHTDFPEIDAMDPPYPYGYESPHEAVKRIIHLLDNLPVQYKRMASSGWAEQLAGSLDQTHSSRAIFEFCRAQVPMFKKSAAGGIGNYRAKRLAAQLASLGGDATLTKLLERLEASGGIVRDKQIGRWITRKLVHDLMVSNPAIEDACDSDEPRYVMDHEKYREWVKTMSGVEDDGQPIRLL